jgi:hypothetical protein
VVCHVVVGGGVPAGVVLCAVAVVGWCVWDDVCGFRFRLHVTASLWGMLLGPALSSLLVHTEPSRTCIEIRQEPSDPCQTANGSAKQIHCQSDAQPGLRQSGSSAGGPEQHGPLVQGGACNQILVGCVRAPSTLHLTCGRC